MLELAGSSVVDWIQRPVTKALSKLRVFKYTKGQYAHNIIMCQKWTHSERITMAGQNKRNLFNFLWNWKWFISEGRLLHPFATGPMCKFDSRNL